MTKTTLLLAACLLLPAAPSFAQWGGGEETKGVFAVGGGFASPSSDGLQNITDTGWSIAGFAAHQFWGPLGARVEGAFQQFAIDDQVKAICPECDKPRITNFGGGLQLGGFGSGVYTLVTVGAHTLDVGVPSGDDSQTEFGMGLGTGFQWAVTDKWGVDVEFKLNGFWPEGDSQWYTSTNFMWFYRF